MGFIMDVYIIDIYGMKVFTSYLSQSYKERLICKISNILVHDAFRLVRIRVALLSTWLSILAGSSSPILVNSPVFLTFTLSRDPTAELYLNDHGKCY